MRTSATTIRFLALALAAMASAPGASRASGGPAAATPVELVSTYEALADSILANKKTERNLVRSILMTTYRHAEATLGLAKGMAKPGKEQTAAIEKLAALVSQLGNEGDAAIAGVRTRLLEGGHHHNAEGEKQGIYDEGFVIVTRAAKKTLLDSAMRIGKLASAPDAKALDNEWGIVSKQFDELMK